MREKYDPTILDVALLPEELAGNATPPETTAYIVVDVIRATTTLSVLFDRGCAEALLAGSLDEARRVATLLRNTTPASTGPANETHAAGKLLLAGESGGLAPPGFDFGNSPAEFATLDLTGQRFVFCTTNGTRALRACAGGRAVFAGCFRNASAIASAALAALEDVRTAPPETREGDKSGEPALPSEAAAGTPSEPRTADIAIAGPATGAVTIVCSGRAQRAALDDTVCAGYLITVLQRLLADHGRRSILREGAQMATQLYHYAPPIIEVLRHADAGRAVIAVGLEHDLELCATIDASVSVPVLTGYDPISGLPRIKARGFARG